MRNRRAIAGLTVAVTLCGLIILSKLTDPRSPSERQPIEVVTATWTMADVGTALATHSKTVYEFIAPATTITVKVADYAPPEATTAAVRVEGSEA